MDAGVQRRDEVAVDETRPRLGVGGGDDDEHLVGVGDDDPLHLVGVVGAAPQQRGALLDADDARRVPSSPLVSPTTRARSPVTIGCLRSSRARARERCARRAVFVDQHGVAASVDAEHPTDHRIGVGGAPLRARAVRLRIGAHPDVGSSNSSSSSSSSRSSQLIARLAPAGSVVRRPGQHPAPQGGNSGMVFAVVRCRRPRRRARAADEGAGRRDAVIVVRAPQAAVQGRHDADAVGKLLALPPSASRLPMSASMRSSRGRGCVRCRGGSSGRRRRRRARTGSGSARSPRSGRGRRRRCGVRRSR
jgi:hypothetical protein